MTRVLIADDDADIRELVLFKLESAGFDVATAVDGQAALDLILAEPPDLVVLDVMMPRMSGLEVCATVRSTPAVAGLPIIMLTAKGQELDITRGLATGADDYMVKPFSPRELLSRVQAALSRQQR